jgi:hypothetical protein
MLIGMNVSLSLPEIRGSIGGAMQQFGTSLCSLPRQEFREN